MFPKGDSGKQAATTSEQQGNCLSQLAKAERDERLAEEAANKRPIGRPKRDCYDLTIWLWGHLRGTAVMHRGIGTHEGKLCGRGKKMRGRRRG